MGRNKNIKYDLCRNIELKWQEGRGTSKRAARAKASEAAGKKVTSELVHSDATKENYIESCKIFAAWIKENHSDCYKNLDAAKAHVPDFLKSYENNGSRMVHASALAKAYGMEGGKSWGVDLGKRPLNTISRGRSESGRQAAWRENHAGAAEALRCCGLRRSEAEQLRGRDVYQREDGSWVVHVLKGKGGLERESVIWSAPDNTAGLDWLRSAAAQAGESGRVFGGVSDLSNANVHALRAEYAGRMYDLYMQDGSTATGEMYKPRHGEGEWDKGALTAVNRELGHGDNRFSTIYYNYLSYGHK